MKENNYPNYYAVLTANVRYDNTISDKAKLIYAELTALANTTGYAYPSNQFIANLYSISERTVSRIIDELAQKNYVKIVIEKTATGSIRKIFITEKNDEKPLDKNVYPPLDKNVQTHMTKMSSAIYTNNTRENITRIDTNRESNNKLVSASNESEKISLSLIKKLIDKLSLKKVDANTFYNYYQLRDWMLNNNLKITVDKLGYLLELWDNREYDKPGNKKSVVNKPDWLNEYVDEIVNMQG